VISHRHYGICHSFWLDRFKLKFFPLNPLLVLLHNSFQESNVTLKIKIEAMKMVTQEDLKQEIEQLDPAYLELVFKLLQQFPHNQKSKPDALSYSRAIDYAIEGDAPA